MMNMPLSVLFSVKSQPEFIDSCGFSGRFTRRVASRCFLRFLGHRVAGVFEVPSLLPPHHK